MSLLQRAAQTFSKRSVTDNYEQAAKWLFIGLAMAISRKSWRLLSKHRTCTITPLALLRVPFETVATQCLLSNTRAQSRGDRMCSLATYTKYRGACQQDSLLNDCHLLLRSLPLVLVAGQISVDSLSSHHLTARAFPLWGDRTIWNASWTPTHVVLAIYEAETGSTSDASLVSTTSCRIATLVHRSLVLPSFQECVYRLTNLCRDCAIGLKLLSMLYLRHLPMQSLQLVQQTLAAGLRALCKHRSATSCPRSLSTVKPVDFLSHSIHPRKSSGVLPLSIFHFYSDSPRLGSHGSFRSAEEMYYG